jgi:hypothetical protein
VDPVDVSVEQHLERAAVADRSQARERRVVARSERIRRSQ